MYWISTQELFNREKFEGLVADWIVATDQPFNSTESPEFWAVAEYLYNCTPNGDLVLPNRNPTRSRIMKMGQDTIEELKTMFAVRLHFFWSGSYLQIVRD